MFRPAVVACGAFIGAAIVGGALFASASTSIVQLGSDIDGEAAGDYSGYSVSLSADGTILAFGAPYNDGTTGAASDNRGHVRVFEWGGSAWTQKGGDIDGEAAEDFSGHSVSLSSDGTEVAIGAYGNDGAGSNAGHVRIYEWNGSAWVQKGIDIDGEAAEDYSGYLVSLSSDGTEVAIGAYGNDQAGSAAGHVRVFEWNGSAWVQKGGDIDGEAAGDNSGVAVSLSSDGTVVAIGALNNDGTGSDAGHVRVFEWNGSAWVQKGIDIDGEAAGDYSGVAVSLSSDGTEVAIGAFSNDGTASNAGHVRLYEWSGSAWVQRGSDIDGEAANDYSGVAVSLSSDGAELAIGAADNDGNGSLAGHVRVFSITTNSAPAAPRVPGQVPPWPEAVVSADGSVRVSWDVPFQDGAGPITGYRVVSSPSGGSCVTSPFDAELLSCVVAGLELDVDYLFEVFASNGVGEGPGRMTQQAVRLLPEVPATTVPETSVPETTVLAVGPQPLPVTGSDDDLVMWSLLLVAFGAFVVLRVRSAR